MAILKSRWGNLKWKMRAANLIRVARKGWAANPAARNPKPSFMVVLLAGRYA